uniref:Uncharacterized protein n=1 Tax=Rhizophora mucronata TaxID=61149 RepID=A0A2P2IZ48_RHIMU
MTSTEEETLSATAKMAESEPEKLVEVNVENNEDGSNRPEPGAREEVAIDIDDFFPRKFSSLAMDAEREKATKRLTESLSGIHFQVLKIQKAPLVLSEFTSLGKCFEPRVMSIGPFHHDKTEELKHGEKLKRKLANHFISSSGRQAEELHAPIFEKIHIIKRWYDEKEIMKPYDDVKELSWLLFVDGCALLQYIRCHVEETFHLLELDMKAHHINLGLQDLFMLENQLPFLVLRSLMDESELQPLICRFINEVAEFDLDPERPETPQVEDINHLLEFLWRGFLKQNANVKNKQEIVWCPSYSATELKKVGIQLEPTEARSLRQTSFRSGFVFGKLEIPPIAIDEVEKTIFTNLIAFEMRLGFHYELVVTSYVCFLNSLIAHAEDVAELRSAKVLYNYLPISDEEVVKIFREMTSNLIANPYVYCEVKKNIRNHFSRRRKTIATWLAEATQVYLKSPWTTVAVLYASLILVLTMAQTIFTTLPNGRL